jgi:hypothetical protein
MSPRLLGYALGNLTQYARRGSENHKTAMMLEEKIKNVIFYRIEQRARADGDPRVSIEDLKNKEWRKFQEAQQGWHDSDMARWTNVKGKDVPNFFDTLTATPPDTPDTTTQLDTPDTTTQLDTPDTGTQPDTPDTTTPPTATIWNKVEGTYKVIGQLWENDPESGSRVIIKGSMIEVEAAFELWDRTGPTWQYKGTAKWDGEYHGRETYGLSGLAQNLKYTQRKDSLGIRIELGKDLSWRATHITIGGNLFNLQQIQSTAPKKVGKILMIKNSAALQISVHLQREPGHYIRKFGSIDANSQKVFTNILEMGRWYISIDPPPDTPRNAHIFTLYVKEKQYVYYFEVKPEYFR